MPPKKREKSDRKAFATKALMLSEFSEHNLKFRTCTGKYTYFVCSRCHLRVPATCIDDVFECSVSLFNKPCQNATLASFTAPLQLCAVCQTSECVYVCLPCMHKCTCAHCAKMCKECPICRQTASSWKKVFDAGVVGTADDLASNDDQETTPAIVVPVSHVSLTHPVGGGGLAIAGGQRLRDEFLLSESSDFSSDSVEYLPPLRQPSGVETSHDRPQRHQMPDDEWVLGTTYCVQWSEAALVARCGNRLDAMVLLQSLEWKLRGLSSQLNRSLARLVDMGFNAMPARVCLLMHDGEEGNALDELLTGHAYVGVAGDHVESVGGV